MLAQTERDVVKKKKIAASSFFALCGFFCENKILDFSIRAASLAHLYSTARFNPCSSGLLPLSPTAKAVVMLCGYAKICIWHKSLSLFMIKIKPGSN